MRGKKLLILALACIVVFVIFSACKKKTEEQPAVPQAEPTVEPAPQERPVQPKSVKALSDDDFIELWAQTAYLTAKHEKDPIKLGTELNNLYEKLGMTADEGTNAYTAWMEEWTKKTVADPENVGKEWMKISERVQKRIEELGKSK